MYMQRQWCIFFLLFGEELWAAGLVERRARKEGKGRGERNKGWKKKEKLAVDGR